MELTDSRSTTEHSLDIDGTAVVEETIELDDSTQAYIIEALASGELSDMSERGVWEELKEHGRLIERVEKEQGDGLAELFE